MAFNSVFRLNFSRFPVYALRTKNTVMFTNLTFRRPGDSIKMPVNRTPFYFRLAGSRVGWTLTGLPPCIFRSLLPDKNNPTFGSPPFCFSSAIATTTNNTDTTTNKDTRKGRADTNRDAKPGTFPQRNPHLWAYRFYPEAAARPLSLSLPSY